MVKNQIPYNRILYSLLTLLILSWAIMFAFAYDPNQGWHPASQIEGVQVKIGPNCGTDNYVYGVKSDGSLYCRPDLQGSGGIACADCDSRFQNEIGTNCGSNNYVYGVSNTGVLSCRTDRYAADTHGSCSVSGYNNCEWKEGPSSMDDVDLCPGNKFMRGERAAGYSGRASFYCCDIVLSCS